MHNLCVVMLGVSLWLPLEHFLPDLARWATGGHFLFGVVETTNKKTDAASASVFLLPDLGSARLDQSLLSHEGQRLFTRDSNGSIAPARNPQKENPRGKRIT
jgi:hypothetical protein